MVKHAAGRAETILRDHFGQRSTGAFTFVARSEPSAAAIVPALATAARRAARELPTGRFVVARAVSPHVAAASIVSSLEPADAKGHTDDIRRAAGTIELYVAIPIGCEPDEGRVVPDPGADLPLEAAVFRRCGLHDSHRRRRVRSTASRSSPAA
jgi:hypothetical protein